MTASDPRVPDPAAARRGARFVHADGSDAIRFVREWPDPLADVWAALTEPERSARWIGSWSGDAAPGATIMFSMGFEEGGGAEPVLIAECDPPRRLSLVMRPDAEAPWRLELDLSERPAADGGGTRLEVTHRIVEAPSSDDVERGWRFYIDCLEASLHDEPLPAWEQYATS